MFNSCSLSSIMILVVWYHAVIILCYEMTFCGVSLNALPDTHELKRFNMIYALTKHMADSTVAVASILDDLKNDATRYTMVLDDVSYPLQNVDIVQIDTPVRGPTARGNVYVEGSKSYRINAGVQPDITRKLSETMLGPSTEFGGLLVVARTASSGSFDISGSLLSMVDVRDSVTLNISIIGVTKSEKTNI